MATTKGSFYKEEVQIQETLKGSSAVKIRVVERHNTGRREVDVRRFYMNDAGEFCPSKAGVLLSLEAAKDMARAILAQPDGELPFEDVVVPGLKKPAKKKVKLAARS